jgi:hypothetical protein
VLQQLVFAAFHFKPIPFAAIIISKEMKDAVHDVANQFLLPKRAKSRRLDARFVNAHKDLTLEAAAVRTLSVVETDHIRDTAVPQKGFVKPGHFLPLEDIDSKFIPICIEEVPKQESNDSPQEHDIEWLRAGFVTESK